MASQIHIMSTGLLVFRSRLVSVATRLGSLVMVARWLNPPGFGLWEFILDPVTFSAYPVGILSSVAAWAGLSSPPHSPLL